MVRFQFLGMLENLLLPQMNTNYDDYILQLDGFFAPVQTDPGAYPASYTMGTGSFPGVKRPGRGNSPPSCAKVVGRVELYIRSPCGPSWPVLG